MNDQPEHNCELFEFAYIPKYDEAIRHLAESLAEKEEWDFSGTEVKRYAILKNYLEHTFRKLKRENKIVYTKDNKYAAFNTGLITENLESIYALFEENKIPNALSPFFLKAFVKESGRQFLRCFSLENFPKIANYFEQPERLIFNPELRVVVSIDHIIENKERFPAHLQKGNDQLIRVLEGAVSEVKKKVRTNYKLAVPQYYKGKIQLLLPLHLTPNSPHPDLALVVDRIDKTTYAAETVLTIKMAYNNARLIVKPQSSWLNP